MERLSFKGDRTKIRTRKKPQYLNYKHIIIILYINGSQILGCEPPEAVISMPTKLVLKGCQREKLFFSLAQLVSQPIASYAAPYV